MVSGSPVMLNSYSSLYKNLREQKPEKERVDVLERQKQFKQKINQQF